MLTALDWLKKERAASELSIMMVLGLPNSGKSSIINAFKLAAKKQGVSCMHTTAQQQWPQTAAVTACCCCGSRLAGHPVTVTVWRAVLWAVGMWWGITMSW
jgi:hypothetical protein